MQFNGSLDDSRVSDESAATGLRPPRGRLGEILLDKPLSPSFTLLLKHNGGFAMLLPELLDHFEVLALVRNPVSLLASWQTVDLPIHQGRMPAVERFHADLHQTLRNEPDRLRRQVLVLDWFFSRFRECMPPERVLRYEDMVASGGRSLFRRLGVTAPQGEPLENRNANPLYEAAHVDELLTALERVNGAWSAWYTPSSCRQAAAAIRTGT